ncbi:hypothetical protein DFP72DRAFT_530263 [Ephemerocybe angulata]|uniref:F-box domain-containing protein n=1 Tax=Ephemerocybe angulata TaxID=980116 RepID=A0A8H6ID62_9AGAR|nr:hypothetical protein DFP72DRAFT_530263 [Tulosesus angulatus]
MDELPPAFAQLLRTNDPPEPSQLEAIRREIRILDASNEAAPNSIQQMKEKRQAYALLSAPIRRVPLDTVGEILAAAIQDSTIGKAENRKELIRLCLVCRTWREAALATHRLWATFDVTVNGLSKWTHSLSHSAENWLNRSGTLPKSLKIMALRAHYCAGGHNECAHLATPALAKLLVLGPPIAELTLRSSYSSCFVQLIRQVRRMKATDNGSWSRIRTLNLALHNNWDEFPVREDATLDLDEDVDTLPTSIFQHLPHITSFHLELPSMPGGEDEGAGLNIPEELLARLTVFSLVCDWEVTKVLTALKSCQAVEKLTLNLLESEFYTSSGAESTKILDDMLETNIILPKLRALHMWDMNPEGLEYLRYFQAPSLDTLHLHFAESGLAWDDVWSDAEFNWYIKEFIRRSGCKPNLRDLHISTLHVSAKELKSLLIEEFPFLRRLTLESLDFNSKLFLKLPAGKNTPLPFLQTLVLRDMLHDDFDFDHVRAFADGRKLLRNADGSLLPPLHLILDDSCDT